MHWIRTWQNDCCRQWTMRVWPLTAAQQLLPCESWWAAQLPSMQSCAQLVINVTSISTCSKTLEMRKSKKLSWQLQMCGRIGRALLAASDVEEEICLARLLRIQS